MVGIPVFHERRILAFFPIKECRCVKLFTPITFVSGFNSGIARAHEGDPVLGVTVPLLFPWIPGFFWKWFFNSERIASRCYFRDSGKVMVVLYGKALILVNDYVDSGAWLSISNYDRVLQAKDGDVEVIGFTLERTIKPDTLTKVFVCPRYISFDRLSPI